MIAVHGDEDVKARRQLPGHPGERPGPGQRVATAQVPRAADRDLHDAVGPRVGEPVQDAVERLRRGDVDRREGEALRERPVEHLRVLLRCGYGHELRHLQSVMEADRAPSLSRRWSPTRSALAIAVSAGFTAAED